MQVTPSAQDETALSAMTDHVRIFDTTLRDGEQAPGCSMTPDEKLSVARQLSALRVDVIEAGFPASSRTDFNAVARIAREVGTIVFGAKRVLSKPAPAPQSKDRDGKP